MDAGTATFNKLPRGDENCHIDFSAKCENTDIESFQKPNEESVCEKTVLKNVKKENETNVGTEFTKDLEINDTEYGVSKSHSVMLTETKEKQMSESGNVQVGNGDFDFDKDGSIGPQDNVSKINKTSDGIPFGNDVGNTCKICNKTFKYAGNLESHLRKHLKTYINEKTILDNEKSPIKVENVEEDPTSGMFSVKEEPAEEQITVSDERLTIENAIQSFIDASNSCSICNKYFPTSRQYRKHMLIHITGKRHKCEHCDKSFNVPSKLQRHLLTHTGNKPHTCDTCGKHFSTADNLKKHKLIHSGEKLFTCDRCSRQFTQAVNLKQHLQTHAREKQYICEICTAQFKTSISLRKHRQRHGALKNHLCEICSKPFAEASKLKIHKLTHTGERNYSCSICGKTFLTSGNMRRHELLHTREKPYSCPVCDKRFAQVGNMRIHMRTHEKRKNKTTQRNNTSDELNEFEYIGSEEEGAHDEFSEIDESVSDSGASGNFQDDVIIDMSDVIIDIKEDSEPTKENGEGTNSNDYRLRRTGLTSVDKSSLEALFKGQRKRKVFESKGCFPTDTQSDETRDAHLLESDIKVESSESSSSKTPVNQSHEKTDVTVETTQININTNTSESDIKVDTELLNKLTNKDSKFEDPNVKKTVTNCDGDMYIECTNSNNKINIADSDIKHEEDYAVYLNVSTHDGNEIDDSCLENDKESGTMDYDDTPKNSLSDCLNIYPHEDISHDSIDSDFSGATIEADQNDFLVEIVNDNTNSIFSNKIDKDVDSTRPSENVNHWTSVSFEMRKSSGSDHTGIPEFDTQNEKEQYHNSDTLNTKEETESSDILNKIDELLFAHVSGKTKGVRNSGTNGLKGIPKASENGTEGMTSNNCGTEFSAEVKMKSDSESDIKDLSCKICNHTFDETENLKKHLYGHIETKTKPSLTCQLCDLTFPDQLSITEHVLQVHKSEDPNTCAVCNKEYSTPRKYKKHMLTHVTNHRYICEVCSKNCPSPSKLQRHLLSHTGQKPYLCVICSRQFSTAGNLKKHSLIHTGEKSYTCDKCCKQFSQAGNLREHMLTHSDQRQWSCDICQAEFKSPARLKTHTRLVHIGDKRHTCEICSKSFVEQSKLRRHMLSHSGEKPHICSHCGLGFSTAGNLKKHGVIHSGEKPYCCETCGKSFTQSGNLKSHMLTHEKRK